MPCRTLTWAVIAVFLGRVHCGPRGALLEEEEASEGREDWNIFGKSKDPLAGVQKAGDAAKAKQAEPADAEANDTEDDEMEANDTAEVHDDKGKKEESTKAHPPSARDQLNSLKADEKDPEVKAKLAKAEAKVEKKAKDPLGNLTGDSKATKDAESPVPEGVAHGHPRNEGAGLPEDSHMRVDIDTTPEPEYENIKIRKQMPPPAQTPAQLHVRSESQRITLRRSGDAPVLTVLFGIKSEAQFLELAVPPGFAFVSALDACGVIHDTDDLDAGIGEDRDLLEIQKASPLAPNVKACEIVQEGEKPTMHVHAGEGKAGSLLQKAQTPDPEEEHDEEIEDTFKGVFGDAAARRKVAGKGPGQRHKALLRFSLAPGIPGLSAVGDDGKDLTWWYFKVYAWNPPAMVPDAQNVFELHWFSAVQDHWRGHVLFHGWSQLGDWDCQYTPWQDFGQCSALCGGGLQRQRRQVKYEPPPDGRGLKCTEPLVKDSSCNTHPCKFPCKFREKVHRGVCSSECGGGIRTVRREWEGDDCPQPYDWHAVSTETCNQVPCETPCRLSTTWKVVTECSARCGQGTFWAFRPVESKDPNDASCLEEWKQETCVRQPCAPMIVMLPTATDVAFPDDMSTVLFTFQLPAMTRAIQLVAPSGFSFVLDRRGKCDLYNHDLAPHLLECAGTSDAGVISLSFETPLPANDPKSPGSDRYEFQIHVLNRPCPPDEWYADIMGEVLMCGNDPDKNQWQLQYAEANKANWASLFAEGYPVYSPNSLSNQETMRGKKGGVEFRWYGEEQEENSTHTGELSAEQKARSEAELAARLEATNGRAKAIGEGFQELFKERLWKERPHFCSIRRACPGRMECGDFGVCAEPPPYRD